MCCVLSTLRQSPEVKALHQSRNARLQCRQALERSSNLRWLHPELGHLERLLRLAPRLGGNSINDAHLAALALEHGATLVSFDRDFEQFRGLRLELLRG